MVFGRWTWALATSTPVQACADEREDGAADRWFPHVRAVSIQSPCHLGSLVTIMTIWISREPIGKFGDSNVYFESSRTYITLAAKFMSPCWILLFLIRGWVVYFYYKKRKNKVELKLLVFYMLSRASLHATYTDRHTLGLLVFSSRESRWEKWVAEWMLTRDWPNRH
jgi:hypothetical protein